MAIELIEALALLSALGAGLVAGIFFAFSNFVMKAFKRLPGGQGIAAMRSINVTVLNPGFFAVFFGAALGAAVLAGFGALNWGDAGAGSLVAGGLCYLLGCILVTVAGNVPLNNALAKVDPGSEAGADLWARYLSRWTLWNHVRTTLSLVAAGLFILTLL